MKTTDLHRIRVSSDTVALLDESSARTGLGYDTLIQLWGAATGNDPEASAVAREALDSRSATQDEMIQELSETSPNLRVTAIRLARFGPGATTAEPGYGFDRTHAGADLTTTGIDLWLSVRGYWAIGTRSNAIAAFRLGRFLDLYAGITWSAAKDKRRYALTGYRIAGRERIDPHTGAVLGAASDEEIRALDFLRTHTLGMPQGAANPIANLFTD